MITGISPLLLKQDLKNHSGIYNVVEIHFSENEMHVTNRVCYYILVVGFTLPVQSLPIITIDCDFISCPW
jgi:hypothetical protein